MAPILVLVTFLIALAVHAWIVRRRYSLRVPAKVVPCVVPMRPPQAPAGVFLDESHAWLRMLPDGSLRAGIDSWLVEVLGQAEHIELPARGTTVRRGDPLFVVHCGDRRIVIPSPVDGRVLRGNLELESRPWMLALDPYGTGWAVALWANDAKAAVRPLKTGPAAAAFLRDETARWSDFVQLGARTTQPELLADAETPRRGAGAVLEDDLWEQFESLFLAFHAAA